MPYIVVYYIPKADHPMSKNQDNHKPKNLNLQSCFFFNFEYVLHTKYKQQDEKNKHKRQKTNKERQQKS